MDVIFNECSIVGNLISRASDTIKYPREEAIIRCLSIDVVQNLMFK